MKLVTKPDDPFDYLLGLKKGGFQRTHGDEFDPSQLAKSGPIIGLASVEDREIDIARQIREVVESNIVIPKDMYIDDGDMPTAQNFYQWITEDRFGAIGEERPFMEQLIWATIAFNDACHVCSDKEWLYHTHKVDDTYAKFERKVALFEFGRCPHCGTTRADQINKGQMKYINELAVNAGQRCVVANTPVLTEHGVFRIVDTLPQNLAYGFTPFSLNVHNGTEIEATSFAFKAKPEPIYKVTFSNGCWIAGTKDHPILTKDGFVTLGDITVGTPVDFQYGMRQFGTVQLPKDEARIHGINFSHGDIPPRLRLGNAAVYEEFLRGLFLSCNRRAFSNMDVLNDVSAMLFNVGVPHRIEAPSIVLSPEQHDLLHGGTFERGFVTETVASVKIDGSAETFDYTLPSSHRFVTGGVISHNSGKSQTVGGFLSPYLTHRMLKLQKPAAYYGLTRNTVLHGTFVALTYVQAKDTLWTPFYGAISESKWFREYHALMRHYENKYGESLLKFNDTFVMYRHRGLTCLVGDTLVDTRRGLIPIKDVNVGDYVKGLRGDYHKVSAFYNNGKKETFKVTTKSGYSVEGTGNHPVLVLNTKTLKPVWKHISDLEIGDRVAVNLAASDYSESDGAHSFESNQNKQLYIKVFELIDKHPSVEFTSRDIDLAMRRSHGEYKNVFSLISKMAAAGILERFPNTGRGPYDPKWVYVKSPTFSVKAAIDWYRLPKASGATHTRYGISIPVKVTEGVARILGYLTAEGSCVNDKVICFYNSDEDVLWDFAQTMLDEFGESKYLDWLENSWPDVVKNYDPSKKQTGFTSTKPSATFRIMSDEVIKFLRHVGLSKALSYDKEVPSCVLRGSKCIQRAFLQALFEGDGSIHKRFGRVVYTSASEALVSQLQTMLAGFGVHSKLRLFTSGRQTHELYCGPVSSSRFLRRVGFRFKRLLKGERNYNINPCMDRAFWFGYNYPNVQRYSTASLFDARYRPDHVNNLKQSDLLAHERIQYLRNLHIVWEPVESIVKTGTKTVYDITVDHHTHLFTANGIIVHNCYPAGPDRRILRGRTRYLASCDEIAYFDSNKDSAKVKVNAHEIYDALTNSLYTLRAAAERLVRHGYEDVFSGYSMNVTSPVAKNDMIHVLGKRAEESDSMYYVHRPTWEVNPDFPRNSKLITEAYRKDPESADKNFGANPPLIANPFLSNHKMIRDLEDFDRKNAIRVRPVMKNSIKAGQGYMYGELDKIKRRKQASMCAIDAGSTDNSFSIAMGHRDGLNLFVDLVSEVIPLPGFRINHSLTYSELILPAMEARNVRVLLADRWNSIKLLDDAAIDRGDPESEEPTFIAKQYSLKYRDLVSVRTCIEQGIVRLPKSEIPVKTLLDVQDSDYRDFYAGKPVAHLFKQLFTIKDLEKSVGKGDGYTDDTWRAVALLVWGLLEEEFAGFLEAAPDEIVTVRPSAIAASKLYSGGGGSVGNGGGSLTTINGAPLAMIGRGKR